MTGVLPERIRSSYAMKFAAIVVCVVVFTGSVGAYSYADTNAKLEDDVNADLQTNAATQADTVSLWVDQRRQTARMISEYEVMNLGVSAQIDRFLNDEIDELPDGVHEVHYVDATSNEILASTADESEETVVTAEEAAWASDDRSFDGPQDVYRSDMYLDDGVPTISFVSPVAGRESVLVVVNADASTVSDMVETSVSGGFTQVVDSDDGEVMMDERGEDLDATYALGTDATPVQRGAAGKTGVATMTGDQGFVGEEYLAAYAPVPGTDWVVVSHAPTATAYAVGDAVATDLFLQIGAAVIGMVALGLTIGRTTVRSLADLKAKANRLEGGDLNVEVDSDRSDEIGQLYAAFGSMRDSLRTQIDEAARAADEAESERERAQRMARRIRDRATSYGTTMERAAGGDLTARATVEGVEDDAMRAIGESFNAMMADLEAAIARVDGVADVVAETSESAEAGLTEAGRAAGEVAASTEGISAGADEQAGHIDDLTGEMADLSAAVEEVTATADDVAGRSEEATERGERGAALADEAVADIEEIRERVDEGGETVEAGLGALGDVVEAVEEANNGVQSISTAADDQAASAEEVVAMADEVATVSEETAAEAQTVSAVAEEQSASLGQVSTEVGRVAERAETLNRLTARFEVAADRAADVGLNRGADANADTAAAATDGGREGGRGGPRDE